MDFSTECLERKPLASPWFWVTVFFVAMMFFWNLGTEGIYAPQEGRTAVITRNMLRNHNYVEMLLPGLTEHEKPILHYWVTVPFGKVFGLEGDPHLIRAEWAVRLPSALAALATVMGAALLARSMYGMRTALVSCAVLSSMATFNTLGRLAHIDMLLAASVTWAMVCLWFGYLRDRKATPVIYGFYAALGLGMMFKGPVGVILPCMVIPVMMVYGGDWKMPFRLRPWTGALIFLVVGCSWYVFESVRTDGAFFREFILKQNLSRFTGIESTYQDGRRMPLWYYFAALAAGAMPWTPFALAGLAVYCKKLIRLRVSPGTVYLLVWFATTFVFFTLSALKRKDYLLPAYPACAILISVAIVKFCELRPAFSRRWRWVWLGLALLTVGALALIHFGVIEELGQAVLERRVKFISKADGFHMVQYSNLIAAHFAAFALSGAATLGLLGYGVLLLERRRTYIAFALFAAVVGLWVTLFNGKIEPAMDGAKSVKEFAWQVRQAVPEGETVHLYGDFNTELIFFIDRPYIRGMDPLEGPPDLLCGERVAKRLLREMPERFEVIGRTPEVHQYPVWHLRRKE